MKKIKGKVFCNKIEEVVSRVTNETIQAARELSNTKRGDGSHYLTGQAFEDKYHVRLEGIYNQPKCMIFWVWGTNDFVKFNLNENDEIMNYEVLDYGTIIRNYH